MTKLHVTAPEAFASTAAAWLLQSLEARKRTPVTVGLSGAFEIGDVYEAWAALGNEHGYPWGELEVYFVDERGVPPQHEDSNCRLVTETLLDNVRSPLPKAFRMEADERDLWDAASRYAMLMPTHFDLLVLSVGQDGHVASLFPGDAALKERENTVVTVEAPVEPRLRMTITPPVIEAAHEKLILVRGIDKAPIVQRLFEGLQDASLVPACLALNGTWIVDEDAASELSRETIADLG